MPLKDFSAFLSPNLELPWKDHVFSVEPPSQKTGLILTALNVTGIGAYYAAQGSCEVCGRSGEVKLTDAQRALVEAAEDKQLGELSLGGVYDEMVEAGVPGPDIDMYSLYAFFFWTLGEEGANSALESTHGRAQARPVPKDRLPRKSTNSTGSASTSTKTKTVSKSTPTTGSQKGSPAPKK